jgi:hypothetical protein
MLFSLSTTLSNSTLTPTSSEVDVFIDPLCIIVYRQETQGSSSEFAAQAGGAVIGRHFQRLKCEQFGLLLRKLRAALRLDDSAQSDLVVVVDRQLLPNWHLAVVVTQVCNGEVAVDDGERAGQMGIDSKQWRINPYPVWLFFTPGNLTLLRKTSTAISIRDPLNVQASAPKPICQFTNRKTYLTWVMLADSVTKSSMVTGRMNETRLALTVTTFSLCVKLCAQNTAVLS